MSQRSFDRPDMARLSQEFEPMGINDPALASRRSSTIASTDADPLGAGIKNALAAIAKLEALGLSKFKIPLPKCVVLGEQSAGKSSVIEAISKIKTPRSTDTCTRCPLHIQMESSEPHDRNARWKARVSLLKRFSFDGNGRSHPYRGWHLLDQPEDQTFAEADDLDSLEQIIATAQHAILNPGNDPKDYLPDGIHFGDTAYPQAEFSPNIVCIKIRGPNLAPLSFYDLPGVIGQSPDPKTQYLVQFVKSLVTEFVKQEDALVLVACSLGNDVANSAAAGMARQLNASHRCVGVLTKPDCLPNGYKSAHLRAILAGSSFNLGHGYFVVKNPTQDELDGGLSHIEARAQEREYFQTKDPWALELALYQDRFGTASLQKYLSDELGARTLSSLPTIRAQINQRLEEVNAELRGLPEPPTHNAVHEVCNVLQSFTIRIRQEIEGDLGENKWVNLWEDLKTNFESWLTTMRPGARLGPCQRDRGLYSTSTVGASIDNSIVVDSDNEGILAPETPSKKRKLEGVPDSPMKHREEQAGPSSTAPAANASDRSFADLKQLYQLDEFAERIRRASKNRIPDQLHPKVLDMLILSTLRHWNQPLEKFFDDFKTGIKQHIQDIFDQEFQLWRDAPIYGEALRIVTNLLDSHFSEQKNTMAAEALRDELEGPYMYHKELWKTEKAAVRQACQNKRSRIRQSKYFEEMAAATGTPLSNNQREAMLKRDLSLDALFKQDPYALELNVIAAIISYYQLAARRFHDAVCMRIESRFLKALRTDLHGELTEGLHIYAEDGLQNCVRLLEEPPARKHARQQLLHKRAQLLEGQKEMNALDRATKRQSALTNAVQGNGINRFPTPGPSHFARHSSFSSGATPHSDEMMDFRYNGLRRRQDAN
ncbi:P-loop containing nucleoside triphosphate hydrolase protein [Amniculicola lignicola CBS 123094]|uniref:P-loop containing nucleoside triphosphate hydrolase protein n=1 Tax=Amniculicola lignicola CBS 123094 TaxID=1392246 RepID=A0A6A5VY82_9PLEO|nr:P-loop containing nucleoside triphosphate hydrolase protein [Amniculicola lignicola CBS 123094]